MTVADDEETLQELDGLNFWSIVQRFIREQSNETTIAVSLFSRKTCFKVAPSEDTTPYTVKVISSKWGTCNQEVITTYILHTIIH